jgi:hypothetical protein
MAAKCTAKQLLATLDKQYGSRFSIIREVSIVDPIETQLTSAYYYRAYPDYYAKSLVKRGLDVDSMPDTTNYIPGQTPTIRRIDALMVGAMDAHGEYPATAVEVKISRADFKRDTEEKRRAWKSVTHRFVYLVPEGLISVDEVPEGCGLWYWVKTPYGARIDIAKRAEVRHGPDDFGPYFTSYLIGRVARAENKIRYGKKS